MKRALPIFFILVLGALFLTAIGAAVVGVQSTSPSGVTVPKATAVANYIGSSGTLDFTDLKADLTIANAEAPVLGTTFSTLGSCRADTVYTVGAVFYGYGGNTAATSTVNWQPTSGNANRATFTRPSAPTGTSGWSLVYSSDGGTTWKHRTSGGSLDAAGTTSVILSCAGNTAFTNTNTTGIVTIGSLYDGQLRSAASLNTIANNPIVTPAVRRLSFSGSVPTWSPDSGTTTLPIQLIDGQMRQVCKAGCTYSTVQAAVNSITDAASNKRYVILVGPGDYPETVTMSDYTTIIGRGPSTRIGSINPPNSTHFLGVMNLWVTDGSVIQRPADASPPSDGAQFFIIGCILGDPYTWQSNGQPIDTIWLDESAQNNNRFTVFDVANLHWSTWDEVTCQSQETVYSSGSHYVSTNGALTTASPHSAWRIKPGCHLYASGANIELTENNTDSHNNYIAAASFQQLANGGLTPTQNTEVIIRNSNVTIHQTDPGFAAFAGMVDVGNANNNLPTTSANVFDFSGSNLTVYTDPAASGAVMGWINVPSASDADWAAYTFRWLSGSIRLSGGATARLITVATGSPAGMTFEIGPQLTHDYAVASIVGSAAVTYARGFMRIADLTAGSCVDHEVALDTGGANQEICVCNGATWTCVTATTTSGPTN